jgi:hypothetical protein
MKTFRNSRSLKLLLSTISDAPNMLGLGAAPSAEEARQMRATALGERLAEVAIAAVRQHPDLGGKHIDLGVLEQAKARIAELSPIADLVRDLNARLDGAILEQRMILGNAATNVSRLLSFLVRTDDGAQYAPFVDAMYLINRGIRRVKVPAAKPAAPAGNTDPNKKDPEAEKDPNKKDPPASNVTNVTKNEPVGVAEGA